MPYLSESYQEKWSVRSLKRTTSSIIRAGSNELLGGFRRYVPSFRQIYFKIWCHVGIISKLTVLHWSSQSMRRILNDRILKSERAGSRKSYNPYIRLAEAQYKNLIYSETGAGL